MPLNVGLSLFDSLLPSVGIKEREELVSKTTLRNGKGKLEAYKKVLQVAELFLQVAKETAHSIHNGLYRNFDALVGNFGCQITALDVQQRVQTASLSLQSVLIERLVQEKLQLLEKLVAAKPPAEELVLTEFAKRVHLDLQISPEMAQLIRYRILCIINGNRLVGNDEIPETKVQYTFERIQASRVKAGVYKAILTALILGLQNEEARKAAQYIRQEAFKLDENQVSRASLIQRLLGERFERESLKQIVSLPLLYNTEASLRRLDCVVLVKNKLFLCGKRIDQAIAKSVFVKMPEERILSEDEVSELCSNDPIVVLEGFIKNETDLAAEIRRIGLINLVNCNTAVLEQYASQTDQKQIVDSEALEDIEQFSSRKDEALGVLRIDHVYCASVKEEL